MPTTIRTPGNHTLGIAAALCALVIVLTSLWGLGAGASNAETPAERCARETSAYNAAWAASWAAANPGQSPSNAPPPPVPYVCGQPQEPTTTTPTPTTAPGLPEANDTGAGPNIGAHAPTDIPAPGATPIVPVPTTGTVPGSSSPATPSTSRPDAHTNAQPATSPPNTSAPQSPIPPRSSSTPSPVTGLDRTEHTTVTDHALATGNPNNLIPTGVWALVGAAALTAGALSTRRRSPTAAKSGTRSLVSGILPAGGSERAQIGNTRLVLINDASSPDSYFFAMDVPPGGHTVINPDGSATVYDKEGTAVRTVLPPWAYDSLGRPQKTWYTADENGNLIQHIDAEPDALYPILADPTDPPTLKSAATLASAPSPSTGNSAAEGAIRTQDPPAQSTPGTIDGGTDSVIATQPNTGNGTGGSGGGSDGGGGQSDPVWEPQPEPPTSTPLDSQPSDPGGSGGEHGGNTPGQGKPPEPVHGNDIDSGFDNVDIPFAGDPTFSIGLRPNLDPAFTSIGQPSARAAEIGMVDADGNVWRPGVFNEPGITGPGFYTTIDGVRVILIPMPDGSYQIWQNHHLWVYNPDGTLRDYMGQVPDPGFVYEKPLGPDVLSAAVALIRLPPGIQAAIAGAAQSIGKPAIPNTPPEPDTRVPNALPGPVPGALVGRDPRSYGVPEGWSPRMADNGKGVVWEAPGESGNANSIRIHLPTDRHPYGYVRFYNQHGQPVDLDGNPGNRPTTHIPVGPDGSFPIPKGWPAQ